MDWKDYEGAVFSRLKEDYPNAEITLNAKIKGVYSKVIRQIDVLIEAYVAGNRIRIIFEAKYFNKKINVKTVESCLGMLEDVEASKAIMVSTKGFSKAAYNRAHFGPGQIELDILNFDQFKDFQGEYAIPYSGNYGTVISSPFGWVADGSKHDPFIATLYQRGLRMEQAVENKEFMYINYYDLLKTTIEEVLKSHRKNLLAEDPKTKIEFLQTIKRNDAKVLLCVATSLGCPVIECTGFIVFPKFIFMCVLITPENRRKQNIRKLENVLVSAIPMTVNHASKGSE